VLPTLTQTFGALLPLCCPNQLPLYIKRNCTDEKNIGGKRPLDLYCKVMNFMKWKRQYNPLKQRMWERTSQKVELCTMIWFSNVSARMANRTVPHIWDRRSYITVVVGHLSQLCSVCRAPQLVLLMM
jgi:hypothetical protein